MTEPEPSLRLQLTLGRAAAAEHQSGDRHAPPEKVVRPFIVDRAIRVTD
jgi:hypothetical protein